LISFADATDFQSIEQSAADPSANQLVGVSSRSISSTTEMNLKIERIVKRCTVIRSLGGKGEGFEDLKDFSLYYFSFLSFFFDRRIELLSFFFIYS